MTITEQLMTYQTIIMAFQAVVVLFGLAFTVLTLMNANKAITANTFSTRFNMYSWLFGPVTNETIQLLKVFPQDMMDPDKLPDYEVDGGDDKIRKYIYLSKVYAYLAFTDSMVQRDLPATFGKDWFNEWLKELVTDDVFSDVHGYLGRFYKDFKKTVDKKKREVVAAKMHEFKTVSPGAIPKGAGEHQI